MIEDIEIICAADDTDTLSVESSKPHQKPAVWLEIVYWEEDRFMTVELSPADVRKLRDWLNAWLEEHDEGGAE